MARQTVRPRPLLVIGVCGLLACNKWNGVPMLLHPTAKTVLADEWGLDGSFSTDLAAVGNLVNHQKHLAQSTRRSPRRSRPATDSCSGSR